MKKANKTVVATSLVRFALDAQSPPCHTFDVRLRYTLTMKSILLVILLTAFSFCFLRADQLRDSPITSVILEAAPELSYVSGDKSWSGGYYTNNYIGLTEFDTNTCFAVLRASDSSLSAASIAARVRDFIGKRFDFPTTKPSSTWQKKLPDGISKADFAEAFLLTYPPNNTREQQGYYLSVQVVRRNSTDFAITVQYSTVTKP